MRKAYGLDRSADTQPEYKIGLLSLLISVIDSSDTITFLYLHFST